MIIWSIQPQKVVDLINETGEYRCDGRKSMFLKGFWNFNKPYKWMVDQMVSRGIQSDHKFPVWGWYKYLRTDKGRKAPRIRQLKVNYSCSEVFYRIKLSVPDHLVLLSDWFSWHEPLNNMFCGSDNYVRRMMSLEGNKTWPEDKIEKARIKSWNKIFNINLSNLDSHNGIQACFPSIRKEYILKIDKI